ncbi:MAG: putative virulence factor, partial [Bacteroidota bacterium]|nr:putative virulence factor [Bacteroidota bacterium]
MATDIIKQIEKIDKSLRWVKKYRPDHYEQRFLQLVEERRKLKKIALASEENPAIAAYGKSQVGKSYLMSNMLQQEVTAADGSKTIKPFEVVAEGGKKYNFINEMNPITTSTEATGVVTRFSSFSRNPGRYSTKYPILMRSLSVMDITLILCDGYFNDVDDYTTDGRAEINEQADAIYRRYAQRDPLPFSPITPDDVLEMKFYFRKYINNAQDFN